MTFALAKHQVEASHTMDILDELAIFYEAGTGKTMCVLDHVYRNDYKPASVLVIAPASVIPMWRRAIANMGELFGYGAENASKPVSDVEKSILFASFASIYTTKSEKSRNGRKKYTRTLKPEYDREWDLVVVDESHCIGNPASIQTQMCLKIARKAKKRVIMSGTPVSGGGGEKGYVKLYSQLLFLDGNAWGVLSSFKLWKLRYVTSQDNFGNPIGFETELLNKKMREYALVARLRDCYDMPDTSEIVIDIDMPKSTRTIYKHLTNYEIDKLPFPFDPQVGGANYIKLLELTSGFVKDTSSGTIYDFSEAKTDALRGILESTDDKVVVFCNFTHSVDLAYSVCSEVGKTVVFDGRSSSPTWMEFQEGDARFLIAQYQSGGTGLDLFASHTTVFFEPTLSAVLLDQAKARTFRKGQSQKCLYYYLAHPHMADMRVLDNVRNGLTITNKMLDEWAKELWGDKITDNKSARYDRIFDHI